MLNFLCKDVARAACLCGNLHEKSYLRIVRNELRDALYVRFFFRLSRDFGRIERGFSAFSGGIDRSVRCINDAAQFAWNLGWLRYIFPRSSIDPTSSVVVALNLALQKYRRLSSFIFPAIPSFACIRVVLPPPLSFFFSFSLPLPPPLSST